MNAGGDAHVFLSVTPEEWRQHLADVSDEMFEEYEDDDESDDWVPERYRKARYLGDAPATEEALMAAEARLGRALPPGLRHFYLASNGWQQPYHYVDRILPIEELQWIPQGPNAWVLDLYRDSDGPEEYVRLFERALDLTQGGEDRLFLDPDDAGADGEWAGWLFSPKYGDLERFESFEAMFEAGRLSLLDG